MTDGKKKKSSEFLLQSSSISGALIAALQFSGWSKETIGILSALLPMIVSLLVLVLRWLFVYCDFKTVEEMTSEKRLDDGISFLKQQIAEGIEVGRDVSQLNEKLNKAILARANLYEIEANRGVLGSEA